MPRLLLGADPVCPNRWWLVTEEPLPPPLARISSLVENKLQRRSKRKWNNSLECRELLINRKGLLRLLRVLQLETPLLINLSRSRLIRIKVGDQNHCFILKASGRATFSIFCEYLKQNATSVLYPFFSLVDT